MKELLTRLRRTVGPVVEKRLSEFRKMNKEGDGPWFSELCFCILTANYTAEGGLRIQKRLGRMFHRLDEASLERMLRMLGHRFPKTRAQYIVEARKVRKGLKKRLLSLGEQALMREWLVKNVKGIGYKEASHFLRNVGYFDLAILDRHVLRLMRDMGLITSVPKSLTKKRYIEIEERLRTFANDVGLSLGELDLYLWYMATGKVLK